VADGFAGEFWAPKALTVEELLTVEVGCEGLWTFVGGEGDALGWVVLLAAAVWAAENGCFGFAISGAGWDEVWLLPNPPRLGFDAWTAGAGAPKLNCCGSGVFSGDFKRANGLESMFAGSVFAKLKRFVPVGGCWVAGFNCGVGWPKAGKLGAVVAGVSIWDENMMLWFGDANWEVKSAEVEACGLKGLGTLAGVEGCGAEFEEIEKGLEGAVFAVKPKEVVGGWKSEVWADVLGAESAVLNGGTIGIVPPVACLLLKTPGWLLFAKVAKPPLLLSPPLLKPPNDRFWERFPTAGEPFVGGKLWEGCDPNWNMLAAFAGSGAFCAAAAPKLNCGVALKDDAFGVAPKEALGVAPKDDTLGEALNDVVSGDGAAVVPGPGNRRLGVLILHQPLAVCQASRHAEQAAYGTTVKHRRSTSFPSADSAAADASRKAQTTKPLKQDHLLSISELSGGAALLRIGIHVRSRRADGGGGDGEMGEMEEQEYEVEDGWKWERSRWYMTSVRSPCLWIITRLTSVQAKSRVSAQNF
jgi:hypothetical protein